MEKTHWKKIVSDPNYIGEADFQEGEEKIVTIDKVVQHETVVTAEGKSQKAACHFREPGIKPMILNVARSKSIEKVAGSAYFEDWPGTRITLYIEHGIKAFGEVVSAVRVRPRKPQERKAEACTDCGGPILAANGRSGEYIAQYTRKQFRCPLCYACALKRSQAKQEAQESKEEAANGTDSN